MRRLGAERFRGPHVWSALQTTLKLSVTLIVHCYRVWPTKSPTLNTLSPESANCTQCDSRSHQLERRAKDSYGLSVPEPVQSSIIVYLLERSYHAHENTRFTSECRCCGTTGITHTVALRPLAAVHTSSELRLRAKVWEMPNHGSHDTSWKEIWVFWRPPIH